MSSWQVIEQLIRNPPLWIMALISAFLLGHVVKTIMKIVGGFPTDRNMIEILHLLMVVILGILTLGMFIWKDMVGRASHNFYEDPVFMLAILLITTFLSMYALYKVIERVREWAAIAAKADSENASATTPPESITGYPPKTGS